MGFGMGAAIGSAYGSGKKSVLITGDGSFGMDLTELATAVTYNVPLTIVVLDNGVLGMVRQMQNLFYKIGFSDYSFYICRRMIQIPIP
jgi:acetolactate synthase-1/2/3 large subunit